jgi:hypothetical protein
MKIRYGSTTFHGLISIQPLDFVKITTFCMWEQYCVEENMIRLNFTKEIAQKNDGIKLQLSLHWNTVKGQLDNSFLNCWIASNVWLMIEYRFWSHLIYAVKLWSCHITKLIS